MTTEPLPVLVFSGVRHAGDYLPMLLADRRVRVVGVCEAAEAPDWAAEESAAVAEANGVPYLGRVNDPGEVPAEAVVVCSEPVRHAGLAAAALRAGRHVLVDKPMATTLPDARALRETAARSGRTLTVVNLLCGPAVRRARHWIDAGHVGFPRHVDVEFLSNGALFASNVERAELVVDPALSGGGEILNFLTYPIDQLRYLTGCEVVEVFAEAATRFFEPHRRFGVEDVAVLSLLLTNGVTGTVTVGRVPYAPTGQPTYFTTRLIGSHGHLTVDEDEPALHHHGEKGLRLMPIGGVAAQANVERCVTAALDAWTTGQAPDYGPDDGLAAVAVIDAAYRSATSGQPEHVSTTPD